MIVLRLLGALLLLAGLAAGGTIIYGAASGHYALGLVRTWIAFGALCSAGIILMALSSGLSLAERIVRRSAAAVLGLGAASACALVLNRTGAVRVADTMQPWALLVVCVVAGGALYFGSRA